MRSDQEIMELILHRAQSDPRILAAYLKGSKRAQGYLSGL